MHGKWLRERPNAIGCHPHKTGSGSSPVKQQRCRVLDFHVPGRHNRKTRASGNNKSFCFFLQKEALASSKMFFLAALAAADTAGNLKLRRSLLLL
jgi:hypothetical protein